MKLVRWAWLGAAAGAIGLIVRQLDHIWSEAQTVGYGRPEYFGARGHFQLSPSQAQALTDTGLSPQWHAAFVSIRFVLVVATTVAIAALLWRKARTWAPLFLAWFLLAGMTMTAIGDAEGAGDLPGWLTLPFLLLAGGGLISIFGLLLVFPDDRSAGWVVAPLIAMGLVPLYATVTDNDAIGDWLWHNAIYVVGAVMGAGLVLQVARVVRSRDRTARDLLALTIVSLAALMTLGSGSDHWAGIDEPRRGLGDLAWRLGYETAFMAVPLVYGLAVLWILVRRGHWDMDVQLKGSVGYAALTTLLVMGYFGVVAVVQAIVNDVSGAEGNTFALMVSTALIAAAILPLRSRLQRLVDRLFDRRRRDVDQLLETFETSVVRDTRPDDVAGALLTAVDDVFHPEHSELWLFSETRP